MSNKNLTWNELEAEIFTPEEIAESRARVEIIASMIERPLDEHIRAYIRIPDGFHYKTE